MRQTSKYVIVRATSQKMQRWPGDEIGMEVWGFDSGWDRKGEAYSYLRLMQGPESGVLTLQSDGRYAGYFYAHGKRSRRAYVGFRRIEARQIEGMPSAPA